MCGPPATAAKRKRHAENEDQSGAKKRFRVQGAGGIKRSRAFLRTSSPRSRRRGSVPCAARRVHETNTKSVKAMLPYG